MASDEMVTITGLAQVQMALTTAPARLVKNAFARALAAACVPVVRELELRTPVSAKNELFNDETFSPIAGTGTGDLKSALMSDIAINSEGKGGIGRVGFGKQGYKARLVETGHRMIGHKPGLKDLGKPVPPHPFMAQAAVAAADAAMGAFAEALIKALKADI